MLKGGRTVSQINDPFAVLGVSSSATEDEIKSAYRKLAKKYHPDLNPGDKAAEAKMREINEAYTLALQIKKNGGTWRPNAGSGSSWSGTYGNGSSYGYGGYGGQSGSGGSYGSGGSSGRNPFEDFGFGFGFDPFGFGRQSGAYGTAFRPRNYAHPDLKTAAEFILAGRYNEALSLLNRIPLHNADWHALYARADLGLGNRVDALDHAQSAVRMAPEDAEYQNLLSSIESGRQAYRRTQQNGYDFRYAICSNPCLTCIAANMLLNCCLGGCRYGMCC